jgi:hypothetical protein
VIRPEENRSWTAPGGVNAVSDGRDAVFAAPAAKTDAGAVPESLELATPQAYHG